MMAPTVGEAIPPFVIADVSPEKMKTMAALIDDPNPIHFDVTATKRLGMGDRVVNQGPSNMAYIVNLLIAWTGDVTALRGLRCRFNGNVFAHDRVVASGRVTAVDHKEEGGVVRTWVDCDVWLEREGTMVVTGSASLVWPHP